jgi:hypothetical protein
LPVVVSIRKQTFAFLVSQWNMAVFARAKGLGAWSGLYLGHVLEVLLGVELFKGIQEAEVNGLRLAMAMGVQLFVGLADAILGKSLVDGHQARGQSPVGRLVMDVHALGGEPGLDEAHGGNRGGPPEQEGVVLLAGPMDVPQMAGGDPTGCWCGPFEFAFWH